MTQLVDFSDDDAPLEQPNTIRVAPPESKSVVVDVKYESKSHLLTFVEGSGWIINYYSQVLNADNAPTGQQPNRNPIYQQYKYIEKLEIRVTSPLTSSQDPTTKEMTLVGSANMLPNVIPNEGDMFIADIGDGRSGIFKITSTERKSILRDTCYAVDYVLINYTTPELREDLNSKIIENYVFRNDFLDYGQNPIIVKSEEEIIYKLGIHFQEIVNVYFKSFYSNEYKTLLVPGQEAPVYDHFLVQAVKKFFNTWDCQDIQYVKTLNLDDDNNMKHPTIWDMLYNIDKRLMNYVPAKAGLVSSKLFTRDPMMEGIYYTRIPYVVYPEVSWKDVDYEQRDYTKPFAPIKLRNVPPRTNLPLFSPEYNKECTYCDEMKDNGFADLVIPYNDAKDGQDVVNPTNDGYPGIDPEHNDHLWDFSDILGNMSQEDTLNIPDIHLVTIDDYYVFGRTFYLQQNDQYDPGMSKLECAVCQMLERNKVDKSLILYFCETYHSWGALERFYYVPILLILIRYVLRSL